MRYGRDLATKEIPWKEYKKMDNGMARNCFRLVDLLESKNAPRDGIDGSIRKQIWMADVAELEKRLAERGREVGRLRLALRRLQKFTIQEVDIDDVECEPAGAIVNPR